MASPVSSNIDSDDPNVTTTCAATSAGSPSLRTAEEEEVTTTASKAATGSNGSNSRLDENNQETVDSSSLLVVAKELYEYSNGLLESKLRELERIKKEVAQARTKRDQAHDLLRRLQEAGQSSSSSTSSNLSGQTTNAISPTAAPTPAQPKDDGSTAHRPLASPVVACHMLTPDPTTGANNQNKKRPREATLHVADHPPPLPYPTNVKSPAAPIPATPDQPHNYKYASYNPNSSSYSSYNSAANSSSNSSNQGYVLTHPIQRRSSPYQQQPVMMRQPLLSSYPNRMIPRLLIRPMDHSGRQQDVFLDHLVDFGDTISTIKTKLYQYLYRYDPSSAPPPNQQELYYVASSHGKNTSQPLPPPLQDSKTLQDYQVPMVSYYETNNSTNTTVQQHHPTTIVLHLGIKTLQQQHYDRQRHAYTYSQTTTTTTTAQV